MQHVAQFQHLQAFIGWHCCNLLTGQRAHIIIKTRLLRRHCLLCAKLVHLRRYRMACAELVDFGTSDFWHFRNLLRGECHDKSKDAILVADGTTSLTKEGLCFRFIVHGSDTERVTMEYTAIEAANRSLCRGLVCKFTRTIASVPSNLRTRGQYNFDHCPSFAHNQRDLFFCAIVRDVAN